MALGNWDAHAKNTSFLYRQLGLPIAAPLDGAATLYSGAAGRHEESARLRMARLREMG